jgi:hypothetical protein
MKAAGKIATLILILMLSVSMASAGDKGKGKEKHHGNDSKDVSANVGIFIDNERDAIRHHYSRYGKVDYRGSLPPGLAKRGGDLPPGLEKQLRRNGHLPPGLEKKLYPFPVELEHRLPPLRPGLSRGMIEGHAIIMDKKTSMILDIFAVL